MAEAPDPTVILDCAICLENLNNPRILPCSHSFCDTCIGEYIISTVSNNEQKTFSCPTCRKVVDVEDPTVDKSKWASFLPLKVETEHQTNSEIQTSSVKNKQNCHPCQLLEGASFVGACVWCKECNEALCPSCSDTHSRLKMTKSHETVPIENIDIKENLLLDKILEANEMCSVHENKIIDAFCFDHSKLCCVLCLTATHKKCENTRGIDEIEEIKDKNILNLLSNVQELFSQLNTIAEQKEENKITLDLLFQALGIEACAVVTDIKNKIDELHKGFCKNAHLLQEEAQNDLSSSIKQIKEYAALLDGWAQNIRVVRSFGSNFQKFVTSQKIRAGFSKFDKDNKFIVDNHQKVTVAADFREALETVNDLDTIGNLVLSRHDCKPSPTKKYNNLSILKVTDIEFETVALKAYTYLNFLWKKAQSVVSLGGELCAVLFDDKSVDLINVTSKTVVDSVVITGKPKRLCYNMVTKTLYVTCNSNFGFTYKLHGSQIGDCKSYAFEHMICGIDTCDAHVFIITNGAVLKSDGFTENILFMSAIVSGAGDDIAVDGQSERLAVLRRDYSNIYLTTMQTKTLQSFIGNNKLKNAKGIAFGPSGLLFVIENKPCSIYVISRDHTRIRTILTKFEKLTSVDDIHVDTENSKLYVCGTGYVEIYDIQ